MRTTFDASVPRSVSAIIELWEEPSDEARGAGGDGLADDVELLSPFGPASGREAVIEALTASRLLRLLAGSEWSISTSSTGVSATATAPTTAPVGGFGFTFVLDGEERIRRVEQDLLPAKPPTASPIMLTDELSDLIARALENGTPIVVAYLDTDGRPQVSYRGTVQAFGSDRLALWNRDPNGGLVRALGEHSQLSFFYGDRAQGVTLQFKGRGRVETDPAVSEAVYANSPAPERNMDWRRAGVAVIVELDRVEGRTSAGPVLMERGASPTRAA